MFSKKFFSQIVNTVSMVTAAYFAGSAVYLFCCVPGIRSIVIFIQLIGIMFTFIMWYCLREWLNERAVFSSLNQQKADIALCLTVYSSGGCLFSFLDKGLYEPWRSGGRASALYGNVLPGRMFILFSGAEHRTSLVCPLKKN